MSESQSTAPVVILGAKHYLSGFSIALLCAFSLFAVFDLEDANWATNTLRDLVIHNFGWLFIATATIVLIAAIAVLFHPGASMRLGDPGELPEFSRWSWFAMLFSAGLASGLIYWGAAEPITHFGGNPFLGIEGIAPGSEGAANKAITVTIFHWGLHGWGLYVIAALAIGLSAHRQNRRLTFSAAFILLFGEKAMSGPAGAVIDMLALFGTVFGVATSIGIAVGSVNATINPLFGIEFGLTNQVVIVVLVCFLGVVSVLTGVAKGIRRLSEINVWISVLLLGAFLVVGPTWYLLVHLPINLFEYLVNVIPMGIWTASRPGNVNWQGDWTVFYWGWWLAWTPFVSLFVARISRGRTVREFVLGVLFVPSLVIVLWMSVIGGTALHQEMAAAGAVSEAVSADYSQGMVQTIMNLSPGWLSSMLLGVVTFLLFTWLITSLDSATLVICHILHVDHLHLMKVLWGMLLGAVTCTLMAIGGVGALQAASIIVGLPMAVLLLLMVVAVFKALMPEKSGQPATGDTPASIE